MPIERGMDREDVVHIHSEVLLSHKKGWYCAICRDTAGPRDCHTEWSKPGGENTNHILTHICGNLKNGTDELICKAEIETQM